VRVKRLTAGALLGACAWPVLAASLPFLPIPIRFLLAWFLFTFGPGIAVGGRLTRDLDPLQRVIVLLGIGSAATPVLIDLLGRMNLVAAFPYVAAALGGGGLAVWHRSLDARPPTSRSDAVACAGLVALTVALGVVVFSHRLQSNADGILLYGDYDSADLGYYASEAAEASHTVPPMAAYYSGHRLNAAYYPHLVLGMIHRFAAVPVLSMYYRYAWPTFLALTALTAFVLVRSLATCGVAALAVVLILVGSDFSYVAAWFLPHAAVDWDYLLWPTNFLSPTMQVLQFSTWTPSMPVFFTTLFAIVRGIQTRSWGWLVMSALLLAILFEFKPFAYIVLMAALCASTVFSDDAWSARLRLAATTALGVVFTLPFVIGIAALDPSDRRSRLLIDFFLLPKRMLIKLDLTQAFTDAASRLAPSSALRTPLLLLMATIVFLVVGIGIRWVGAPGVWCAIRGSTGSPRGRTGDFGAADAAAWRLLAWGVVAGIAIPFVIATDPYVDTLQFYLTGLYLMWIFAAVALMGFARAHRSIGGLAVAAAIALTLPSSIHYLARKWTDAERPPKASLSRTEMTIADYLRTCDPEQTVILHDRPLSPSLMTIVAERRIVLGWDVKYSAVGGEDRLRDINAFYASAGGDPDAALETLRRYHVTHVIVREQADHVHPTVLGRLNTVMRFPDVTLYSVPR
jgi:hypothetical protein